MREWMVIRLGRPEDTTKPHLMMTGEPQVVEDFAVQDAPRARTRNEQPRAEGELRGFAAGLQQPAQPQRRRAGYGYHVKQADRDDKSGQIVHTSEEAAQAYAKELAARFPKVLFGVFSCVRVYETTEPQVIEKSFNDGGELVIESAERGESQPND
jgi:hypothetical protein